MIRSGERAGARDDRDPVAGQLSADHVVFPDDHVRGARGQVGDGDLVLDSVRLPVDLPLVDTGEVKDRLAEGLGRDRPRVEADPADHLGAFYHRDPPVELRGCDRRLLPAWPGPDHQQVKVVHTS